MLAGCSDRYRIENEFLRRENDLLMNQIEQLDKRIQRLERGPAMPPLPRKWKV